MNIRSFTKRSSITIAATLLGGAVVAIILSQTLFAQYTGVGNHALALSDAQRLVQNFQNRPVAPANKSVYYERNIYDKILSQPGCVGIRQYFAQDGSNNVTLVLVGVDASGNDLVNGTIGEGGMSCPPLCAPVIKLY